MIARETVGWMKADLMSEHQDHVEQALFHYGCRRCEWLLELRAKLYELPEIADMEQVVLDLDLAPPWEHVETGG